jgi:hypothetical protein
LHPQLLGSGADRATVDRRGWFSSLEIALKGWREKRGWRHGHVGNRTGVFARAPVRIDQQPPGRVPAFKRPFHPALVHVLRPVWTGCRLRPR